MSPDETASEEKSERSYWGFVLWPVVAVVLYVLTFGPMVLAGHKGVVSRKVVDIYLPLLLVSEWNVVGKPIRVYLHFWIPDVLDIHGKDIGQF